MRKDLFEEFCHEYTREMNVESRYRRPVSVRSFAERLMRLDAALLSPACEWLTSPSEKLAYVQAHTRPTAPSESGGSRSESIDTWHR